MFCLFLFVKNLNGWLSKQNECKCMFGLYPCMCYMLICFANTVSSVLCMSGVLGLGSMALSLESHLPLILQCIAGVRQVRTVR